MKTMTFIYSLRRSALEDIEPRSRDGTILKLELSVNPLRIGDHDGVDRRRASLCASEPDRLAVCHTNVESLSTFTRLSGL